MCSSSVGDIDRDYLGSQVLLLLCTFMVPDLKEKSIKNVFTNTGLSVVS